MKEFAFAVLVLECFLRHCALHKGAEAELGRRSKWVRPAFCGKVEFLAFDAFFNFISGEIEVAVVDFYRNGGSVPFDFIVFAGCFVLYIHLGAAILEIIRICQSEKGTYEFGVLYFYLVVV